MEENHSLMDKDEPETQTIKQEVNKEESLADMPQTSEDVEEAKKQFNSGGMSLNDNQAENLITIQNAVINGGFSSGSYNVSEILKNDRQTDKEYDLSNAEEFAEFGEAVKAGEYFAIAVILCVFDYIALDDLENLKSNLLNELPKVTDEEGKEIAPYQNAYLSINSLLKTIKGEMVILNGGERCIRLSKKRSEALKNLWQQFPEMRSNIASWLLNVSSTYKYRTNFDTVQITKAFVNILKLDFNAGSSHFLPRFYSSSDNSWLLGFIALELYNDSNYSHKTMSLIYEWLDSSSSWKWKSAVYVFANIKEDEKNEWLENKVRKNLIQQYNYFEEGGLNTEYFQYMGVMLISSQRLRTILASVLGELVSGTSNHNQKRTISLYYLMIVRYCYYFVSTDKMALPLVICDNKKQLLAVLPLVEIALWRRDARQNFFSTIESYVNEISGYNVDKKTLNHLKAFFQLLTASNPRFYDDILLLLKKCDSTLAEELVIFLFDKRPAVFPKNLPI